SWRRRLAHQSFHLAYRVADTGEDRARDDGVTDVQFRDPRDGGDRLDVVIVQTVPGVHLEPERATLLEGAHDAAELLAPACLVRGVRVVARVYFHDRRPGGRRRFHLRGI